MKHEGGGGMGMVRTRVMSRATRTVLGIAYAVGLVAAIVIIAAVTLAHVHSVPREPIPQPLWQSDSQHTVVHPTYANGLVFTFATSDHGGLAALDAVTGAVRWQIADADPDHLIFDATRTHFYYAFSDPASGDLVGVAMATTATGARQWVFNAPKGSEAEAPLIDGGQVYVIVSSDTTETMQVLDAQSGSPVHSYPLPTQYRGIALDAGILYLYISTNVTSGPFPESVRALDAATGRQVWTTSISAGTIDDFIGANHLLFITEDDLGPSGHDAAVMALDSASGKLLWTFRLHDAILRTPVVTASAIYVGAASPTSALGTSPVSALDPASGRVLWQSKDTYTVNQLADSGNALYVAQSQAPTVALDITTGSVLWHSPASAEFLSVDDPYIAASGNSSYLFVLNARDGSVAWDWYLPNVPGQTTSLAGYVPCAADGRVFISSHQGMFAFNERQ